MAEPYVGEIRLVAFNFAPTDWAFCNGAAYPISQNEVLYTLIGTTYGGDGVTYFNLPNLQSRVPIHAGSLNGNNYALGQLGGEEQVTLTTAQLPSHTHALSASSNSGTQSSPAGNIWAASDALPYSNKAANTAISPVAVGNAGNSLPHNNLSPYLAINFIIALYGIFPTQT